MQSQPDVSDLWIQHQRRNNKTTASWACTLCEDRRIYSVEEELKDHAKADHRDRLPEKDEDLEPFLVSFAAESSLKRPSRENRKPNLNEALKQPEPPPMTQPHFGVSKRPFVTTPPTPSISGLGAVHISTPRGSDDVAMQDVSDDSQEAGRERKRAAVGDGISAGSGSPGRESSASPQPRRSKARGGASGPYVSSADQDTRQPDMLDTLARPHVAKGQLWSADQDSMATKPSHIDRSNVASFQIQKQRAQAYQPKNRKSIPSTPQILSKPQTTSSNPVPPQQTIQQNQPTQTADNYDIILQPETRPISQEQLVAEVKGIYAGLVMVEAKCIEVDNKQATLAQADSGTQPKLNNEQWQALIALHRTLLHEHHDFFLASQHPSASPALRRLASKYAMPARMWRHGIHSFLELLRHRLPASLDHMLAFIYLAYSMMALLYETVPAFEDTWIECLGDLGRYRMAIEDDDIRDREVWTGVARLWYSKASDKAPTTGRLYHHLAILARPNALQQLFYYSKSLDVAIPFTSARESILTLFEPVLNAGDHQNQYRLPPLDTAFVKAHGMLFTNRSMEKFRDTVKEFLGLLDNQIGRVTRKFMEQGYYLAVANSVAMMGFAAKVNPLMVALSGADELDEPMTGTALVDASLPIKSFEDAEYLSNATLEIVLQRIGDPNVLPFIHVTMVFILHMARHPRAMRLLEGKLPWVSLVTFLNTLLAPYQTLARIESSEFPTPVKDDVRPFTEDFAMRGLLFSDGYYPENWFSNDKIDDEEKYLEVASMTDDRKERVLWIAVRVCELVPWIQYDGNSKKFSSSVADIDTSVSRSSTFASATTINRQDTWRSVEGDMGNASEEEDEFSRESLGDPRALPGKPGGND